MSFAKRFGILALILALASTILIFLSPSLVSNGLRFFLWWKGRAQGLNISYQKIDAPFLKPVVIEGLRVTNARPCVFRIDISIPRATFTLNLRRVFFLSNARLLHQAWIDGLRCEIRRDPNQTTECNFDWRFLHHLLADEVRLGDVELRFASGMSDFAIHGGTLTASEIESGKFAAKEISVSAPFFHQTFADLRGATKWENDRLTIGALSLARGLDIETITADFSRLERRRIGIELNLDAFGGKLRASIASENRDRGILWDVAGSASAISLSQMSTALGLRTTAGGTLRASKFTFRGDAQDLSHATASVWMELSGFTWRDRVAETVMLGTSLYNRQVEVQQLYVKQRTNQLTLTGEYALPEKSADWINPNFRADISASVPDLGEFANLFLGTTSDFAGALTISGTVNGRDRNFAGQITADGDWLRLWGAPVDNLRTKLTLKNAQLHLDSLQARHLNDFFNATGEVNLLRDHAYSIKANGALENLAEYSWLLPEQISKLQPQGRVSLGWDGRGTANAHSGDFQIQGESVRLTNGFNLQPFDAKIAGNYSPQSIFCREFRFTNPKAEFDAFLSVAPNYLQLQSVRFDLNGKAKLHGGVFVPVAIDRWWRDHRFVFDPKQSFSVDLTLDELDLAELQNAVSNRGGMTGLTQGRLEIYGPSEKLQAKCDLHLRDFSFADPRRISADLNADIISSLFRLTLIAMSANSSPVKLEIALPLQLTESTFFDWDKPMTLHLSCTALLLSKLPPIVTRVSFRDGILSANVDGSGTMRNPSVTGNISCLNGRFAKSPGPVTGVSGQVDFRGAEASITFMNLEFDETRLPLHGSIDLTDTSMIPVKFIPDSTVYELVPVSLGKCVRAVNIFSSRHMDANVNIFDEVEEAEIRVGFHAEPWTISLTKGSSQQQNESHSLCDANGDTLELAVVATPKIEFGQRAVQIFRGRNRPAASFRRLPPP
jgi:hypothetical protein